MKLNHGLQLAYCTNVHRGEDWQQTFQSLRHYVLPVRDLVAAGRPYAIGLRLSDKASRELLEGQQLSNFRSWLETNNCYVFTINGFPFGAFHGTRVKEQVYAPDWTTPERLAYTNRLFDILAELMPKDAGLQGSVSTLPGSFKDFIREDSQVEAILSNVRRCAEHIDRLCQKTGRDFHLGLEPEPLGLFETSEETVNFLGRLREGYRNKAMLERTIGVNYDTCHLAVEYEQPTDVVRCFAEHRARISKLHLSSALTLRPSEKALNALQAFHDEVYLHQVISRHADGSLKRFKDLDLALNSDDSQHAAEWRVHFHIPLHSPGTENFNNTSDHLRGVLDILREQPTLCSHLEMETYTWEVMPAELKKRDVIDQLASEYAWTLKELKLRGLSN